LGRALRQSGLSYGEIMDLIPVKKSTLATWCREIRLSPDQIAEIRQRTGSAAGLPRDTQRKRRAEIEELRGVAAELVAELSSEPLWVAGLVMYWAEGSKGRNRLSVANTDPRALRLFLAWVRRYILPSAEFTLHLHLHEGNDELAAREYWRSALGMPHARFIKSFVKPEGTGHRKNHLKHGLCTVRMQRAADAWQITMTWIDVLATRLGLDNGPG
jgi:hypothetical protein